MKRLLRSCVVCALAWTASAAAPAGQNPQPAPPDRPCGAALSHERARGVLDLMDRLPTQAATLWDGYRPADAAYLFVVQQGKQPCGIVWRNGRAREPFALAAEPRKETPLYSFFVPQGIARTTTQRRSTQPEALAGQLRSMGFDRAVMLFLDGDAGLPFTLGSANHFDIAVHEGFHAHVQLPTWYRFDSLHRWPAWSEPTADRVSLASSCYGSADPKAQDVPERPALVEAAMTALTGGSREAVCRHAGTFVAARRERWMRAGTARVASEAGGRTTSCSESESIMELNEGVPDFVAWMTAHELGVVDESRVRGRFSASQRDLFYVMGAMQLTVLRRLQGDAFPQTTTRIASSASPAGGVFAELEAEVARGCP